MDSCICVSHILGSYKAINVHLKECSLLSKPIMDSQTTLLSDF